MRFLVVELQNGEAFDFWIEAGSRGDMRMPVRNWFFGSVTITANGGYAIAGVLVDGTSVGAVSAYIFHNVTSNHTISASFGQPVTVIAGQQAAFTSNVTGGSYTYKWYKNGVAITGATGSSYTVPVTSSGDAATYNVTVTNANSLIVSSSYYILTISTPVPAMSRWTFAVLALFLLAVLFFRAPTRRARFAK